MGDGTGTWIGSGAVGNGGVAPWVGDTTPPGKPAGVSATSAWGTVYAKWDGTLEGGVPEDFAYVEVAIDGVVVGRITEAGTVAVDGYEDGHEATVAFVAYDAARDRTGALSPNDSDAAIVQVTVSNERDAIDEAVREANDKADALQQEVTDVKATVSGVEQDVTELSSQVSGAVEKADQSLSVATEAKQTADAISDTAERAYEDAQSALTQASSAVQTATQLQTTVEENYLSKDEATGTYASKSDVTQTASDILSTVESEYQSKDGMGSYYTKTEVDQKNDAITSTVSEAVATADGAMEKATTVEQTVDGLEVTLESTTSTANSALSAAQSAQSAATDARKVATNYLGFSSSGLVVGTNSSGTGQSGLQGNVRLTSGGMEVRSGSTVLARYAASHIDLGMNSTSSKINLCGGAGKIFVDGSTDRLSFASKDSFTSAGSGLFLDTDDRDPYFALDARLPNGKYALISTSSTNPASSGGYLTLGLHAGQILLEWDRNGLSGMVMQQIWSGSWITGSITVNNIGKYNMLVFACNSGFTEFGIAVRYPGSSRFIAFSMNPRSSLGFTFDTAAWTVSGTRVTKSTNAHATLTGSNGGTGTAQMSQNTGGVYRIWGVL